MKIIKKNKKFIIVYKEIGNTSLQVLDKLKEKFSYLKKNKLTYAGRLDPMAEGKLLVLIGDECKKKEKYLKLDKEYNFEILIGLKTDTADILGLVKKNNFDFFKIDETNFQKEIQKIKGKQIMEYPAFSSKTVNGKPLFEYAKKGEISKIIIPKKEIEIYKIKYLSQRVIIKNQLEKELFYKINLMNEENNNFRKEEILKKWSSVLKNEKENKQFLILKFRMTVSSGTYIRNIAEEISEKILNNYGLALSIKRNKIGWYKKIFNLGFWL